MDLYRTILQNKNSKINILINNLNTEQTIFNTKFNQSTFEPVIELFNIKLSAIYLKQKDN